MARLGVTFGEVANAAKELASQGKNPTVEQVRLLLGTGSSTTIAAHLRAWRGLEGQTTLLSAKEQLPEVLVRVLKGLWDRVIEESQDKIDEQKAMYEKNIEALQQGLKKYKDNNRRWQQLFCRWLEEKDNHHKEKQSLIDENNALRQQHILSQTREATLIAEIKEKEAHIDALIDFQANFEKEREYLKVVQRDMQAQQQQELNALKNQLEDQKTRLSERDKTINELTQKTQSADHKLITLENNHKNLIAESMKQKEMLSEKIKENTTQRQEKEARYKDYLALQATLNQTTNTLLTVKTQVATLTQQLQFSQQTVNEMSAEKKLIEKEKWQLAEERAHLTLRLNALNKEMDT